MSPKVFAVAGSLRKASFNRKLLSLAAEPLQKAGIEVDLYDLKTAALPVYDEDLEVQGFSPEVLGLKRRIAEADALLIVTPEYNHGVPGGLKNAIDWASRPLPKIGGKAHPHSQPFKGKIAATLGATIGRGGTSYAQLALREVLYTLGVWTLPGAVTVSEAQSAFDPVGRLVDARLAERVTAYLERFAAELSN